MSTDCLIMDEQEPIDLDRESDVEEKKEPAVGDKRKADIWHNFDVNRDEKTQKIIRSICKFCSGPLKVTTKGGTSSMIKHLNSCPSHPNSKNKDKNQQKISTNTTTISNWEFNQTSTRLALAKMIVIDEQPFSYVERYGFRLFCSVAVPQFCLPSRFTVAKDIGKLYLSEVESLRNTFKGLTQNTKIGSSSSEQFRAVPVPVPKIRELLLVVPVSVPKTKEPAVPVPVPVPEKRGKYLPMLIPNYPPPEPPNT
ncbi:hypothetical protein LXL04_005476 [Taraxacum kok-saghyz]